MPPGIESVSASPPSRSSPTMRRASPLPFPTYQTSSSPWQNGTITSAASSNPNPSGSGKTSQVIERLTAENDRLRRELNAEKAAKDESLQAQRVLRVLVDQLEDKNGTLKHQFDTHDGALTRKERRLDDLKASLEQEVARRRKAEDREAEMGRKLDEIAADAARQVAEFKNAAKASETAYTTMSRDYLSLRGRLDTVRQSLNEYVTTAEERSKERQATIFQLEVLLDQKRQAMEQATKANREQAALLDEFKAEFKEVHERKQEMIDTTQKMRWVMGLQGSRNSRNRDGLGSADDGLV